MVIEEVFEEVAAARFVVVHLWDWVPAEALAWALRTIGDAVARERS